MAKRTVYRGSVSLVKNSKGEGLNGETIIRNGVKGIFIPVENNPAIYFKVKEDNSKIINLDIEVTPTPDNKYGNSHYIRLSVGKENREKYGIQPDQLKNHTPIVGNLKEFTYQTKDGTEGEDLPPSTPQAGNAPQQFDPSW